MTRFISDKTARGMYIVTPFATTLSIALLFCVLFTSISAGENRHYEIPLQELKRAGATDTANFEIPLSELKRITTKKPAKKTAEQASKAPRTSSARVRAAQRRPSAPTADPAVWGILEAVRSSDDGIRLDIDDLGKFKLLLEPLNKKVVLQLSGVDYPDGAPNLPLNAHGFVQARIGRHPDGTWVVLDTAEATLPAFSVAQDRQGIILKTAGAEPPDDKSSPFQVILLSQAAVASARTHQLVPDAGINPVDEEQGDDPDEDTSTPDTAAVVTPPPAPAPAPPEKSEPGRISHIPYSFVVAERHTLIQAVVSSTHDIKEVYCVVQTAVEGKPAIVLMTKVADTRYTYEGKLPGQPANGTLLRYTIVARDSQDREMRSKEFTTPLSRSAIIPGWQQ